jgi:transcriptional regulator with XRE-family HTH domain
MEQPPLNERLKNFRERSLALPGGIKSVAIKMGKAENTLHNWFKGNTNPTVEDVELLKETLIELEAVAVAEKAEKERRLNAALA